MRTFIDSYRKPLLAVFGVLLMIVFMLPANIKSGADSRNNPVIGHIGKDPVHAAENSAAEQDWEILTRRIVFPTQNRERPFVPLAVALLPDQSVAGMINNRRQSFLLLVKEAEMHGVTLPQAEVNQLLDMVGIVENNRVVSFTDIQDLDVADRYRTAIEHLLLVRGSYNSAADTIKVSQPLRRQLVAQAVQTVDLKLVDVPASQFTTAAPTPQQLEEQFKKYADISPEDSDRSPHGYGYRFADRVKLQTIEVPVASVRAAAERARTKTNEAQYQWEKDAFKYYTANQGEFPTTQPTTTATTTPAAPTTRPFAQAKTDALARVLDADVASLTQRIIDRITSQMAGDYVAYRNAINTGGASAKLPVSSVTVPYNSYDYLQRLSEQVQKQFGLLPPTTSYEKDYLAGRELTTLPGLGQTPVEGQPFASFVLTRAAAFASGRDEGKTLQLLEPAPVVRDEIGNAFVFRLTDAQKAHAPASLQEVAPAVEADVRAAMAFEQARKVGEDLIAKAKSAATLESVATAAGRNVINLPAVGFRDPGAIAPLHLNSPYAQRSFLRQTFELMSSATKENPRPMGIIDLPREGRALVAQITDVHSELTAQDLTMVEAQAGMQAAREMSLPLLVDWFKYDSIVARLNFQPTAANEHSGPTTPSNPNTPPAGQPLL